MANSHIGRMANAIEPAPTFLHSGPSNAMHNSDKKYAVLTDSEVGVVRMLRLDVMADDASSQTHQVSLKEVATLKLVTTPKGS